MGSETQGCGESLGQDGTTDVADAESQLGKRSEPEGNQRGQPETAPGNRSGGEGGNVADTETKGLEGRDIGTAVENQEPRVDGTSPKGDLGEQSTTEAERNQIAFESYLGGGTDGLSSWMDGTWERGIPRVAPTDKARVPRLKALGNAVVPQLVYWVGMAIVLSTMSEKEGDGNGR